MLTYLRQEGEESGEPPTNADLVSFLQETDRETVYKCLTEYDALTGAASHLDPDSSRQASGVYASVQRQINDTFVGDFAKDGQFSIRGYMDDPKGRALVLDYPYREGESTTPIFRLLIDLAAREALDEGDRGSYFILDEIAQVPALSRLDELVNVGAGRNIQVLVTLQSVAQLRDGYGKDAAEAILSGFLSAILLRCGDGASVEFARERIGTRFVERTANVEKARVGSQGRRRRKTIRRETKDSEEYPFAKGDFTEWSPGEGVVVRPDSWAYGRTKLLGD
jgi:type IV secretory pathway TraG/TraD family ATPase VirD4